MANYLNDKERTYTKELIELVNQVPADEQLPLVWMLKGVIFSYELNHGRKINSN